jgi:hypothetical protein
MCDASLIHIKTWGLANHSQSSGKQILRESECAFYWTAVGHFATASSLLHILSCHLDYALPPQRNFLDAGEPVAYTSPRFSMDKGTAKLDVSRTPQLSESSWPGI